MKKINPFFMRKYLSASVLLMLTVGLSHAQSDSSYTLQQCIDYALLNSKTIQNAQLDVAIAKAKVGEYRSIGLPQVNATGQLVDNPRLQRMFLSNGAFFNDPTAPFGETVAVPNLFQLRTSGDVNATATQLLFSGSYFIGLKAAKALGELSEKSAQLSKTDVVENVTKAFYMVVINRERITLIDANVARLDSTLIQTRALNQQGFIESIDVDRLEVAYNNLITERDKFNNLVELSTILLKFQMGYELDKAIFPNGLATDFREAEAATIVTSADYNNRMEYQLLLTQRKLESYNLKNIRAGYLPTLSAFGTLGTVRMDKSVGEVFGNQWFSYNRWGVQVNMALFDSFGKYYKAQQSKLELKKIDNSVANFETVIDLQKQQADINLKNSLKTTEVQKKNLALAKKVVDVAKIKYQQGVGSNIEVIDAENSYKESQTNYYNALYELLVAQLEYKKAIGTLYTENN